MSDFEPSEELKNAVAAAFKLLARVLQVNKKAVYGTFEGDFDGELSQWGKGKKPSINSQIGFTETLIRIFSSNEKSNRIANQKRYDQLVRLIRANPENAAELRDLVNGLTDYLWKLRQKTTFSLELAARKSLSEANADLSGSADGLTLSARNAKSQFGDALVSLPTFPQHIKDIVAIVRGADHIVIHADSIDYGSFRDFELHRALLEVIIDRARAGKTVEILIWTDRQPMSWANRFRRPEARSDPEFELCLQEFLAVLKKRTNLATTDEYKIVEDCLLKKANWVSPEGDIKKLLRLQMKLHELELGELNAAGVNPRGSNKEADLAAINTERDRETPTQFYWIVDGPRGIIVQPALGTDAPAMATGNRSYLHGLLTNFYSIYNRPV